MSFKISEICDINVDNLSKQDDWEYINYLDTANLNEGLISDLQYLRIGLDEIPSRAKRKVKCNDILYSTVRPNQKHYGIIKFPNDNMIASTGFAVLTPKHNIVCPEYLYRFLIQEKNTEFLQAVAETSTSAYPAIKPSVIGDIEINLPPIEEQKAIAYILSSLDEKIETNNKINKTLEEMAQTIFKRWFVDFEFPNEEGEPYKSSGGEMEESELGMIPKGWRVGTISDLGDIVGGATPSKKNDRYFVKKGIPWITPKDLSDNRSIFIARGAFDITDEAYKSASVKLMPKGAVLFSSRAPIGYIAIAKNEVTTNQGFKSIVPKSSIGMSSEYIYLWLKENLDVIENRASGSTFKEISGGEMKKIPVIIPNMKIQKNYSNIVMPMFKNIEKNEAEIRRLKQIRDTLLPKLMSGKIRVPLYTQD